MTADASSGVLIRPATPADVHALDAVTRAAETPADGQPGWPPGAQEPYLSHLVSRGRVITAELDGEIVGFAATVDNGRATHLADLFVARTQQGRGIGGRLLGVAFGDATRRTTFASNDPRALPLYVRAGMHALWPSLYVDGDPRRLERPARDYEVRDATLDEMAELERRWTGVDRSPDLAYWASQPGARPFVVESGGRPVGTGRWRRRLRGEGAWLGAAQAAPDTDPGPVLLAAMAYEALGPGPRGGCVPGPSPLLPALLAAGFRIVDRDTFMATDAALVDPARTVLDPGIL